MLMIASAVLFFAGCEKDNGTTATNDTINGGGAAPTASSIVGSWNMIDRQPDELGNLHSLWTFNADGRCSMRWYQNNMADENDGYEDNGSYTLKNDTIYFVSFTDAEYTYFIERMTVSNLALLFIEESSRYTFERVNN